MKYFNIAQVYYRPNVVKALKLVDELALVRAIASKERLSSDASTGSTRTVLVRFVDGSTTRVVYTVTIIDRILGRL